MEAQTLNCPMCGASAATDATKCQHCGARLATISCPSCFGMIFVGAKFCCHCGAPAARGIVSTAAPERCPRCQVEMKAVVIGVSDVRECPKCDGLWANQETLQQICSDREKQAAVLGMPHVVSLDSTGALEKNIRYVPCPVCKELMNRVNFSRCSNVIVDVCAKHGTWFDKDELRRIVEFIRAGGMDKARAQEMRELEQRRRDLEAARASGGAGQVLSAPAPSFDGAELGVYLAASALKLLMRTLRKQG